jgi:stearoyl-CoA desaturase (delta-9 desaturase)
MRVIALVVLPLLGTFIAIYLLWNRYVFARDIGLLFTFYLLTGLGVTIGYHRMLTHQGFEAPAFLRALLLLIGCMAFEGAPIFWAATHIKHHAHSDEEDDPHSPLHGFWHAHIGWLFHPERFPDPKVYAPHLLADPVAVFVDRFAPLWIGLSLLLPFLLGGWTGLVWGGGVRIFLLTHMTWSVNSVCHCFGKRPFETTDESRNHWVVGLLGFGEGWHNNHHAFPRNAFHGLRWWQFDLSGLIIRMFEALGLAWNVQHVSREIREAHRARAESLREGFQALRADLCARISVAKAELSRMIAQRLEPPVSEQELLAITESCEQAVKRLEEMQEHVAQATHLKKQKLLQYRQESAELLSQVKARTTRKPVLV